MRLLLSLFSTLCMAVASAPGRAHAQVPGLPLAGVYKGELGQLAVSVSEDGTWVSGYVMSGFCGAEPGRVGLDGAMEGAQLAGRLLACVKCGRGIEELRVVDFMAAWLPGPAQWVGYVALESTCALMGAGQGGAVERVAFSRDPQAARPLRNGSLPALERRAAQELEQLGGRPQERVRQGLLRALSFDPSPKIYARVAGWMAANGEPEGALQLLERAVSLPGAGWEPHVELARQWARRKEDGRALSALRAALDARLPRAQEVLGEPAFLDLRGTSEFEKLVDLIRAEKERPR